MKTRSLILVLSLQCLLHSGSLGFVLRKRSTWDENSLAEALQVIERERRRLEVPQEDDVIDTNWGQGDKEIGDELLGSLLEGDGSFINDDSEAPSLYSPSDWYSDNYEGVGSEIKPTDRKRSDPLENDKELQSILEPSDDERIAFQLSKNLKKKSISNSDIDERQYDLDYKKRLYDPSREDFEGFDKKSNENDKPPIAAEYMDSEISNLLHQVENAEKQVIADEEEVAEEAIAGKPDDEDTADEEDETPSQDELEDVLKDEDDSDDDAEGPEPTNPPTPTEKPPKVITVVKTEEKEWPEIPAKGVSVTRESIVVQPGKNDVTVKRKRSGHLQDQSDVEGEQKDTDSSDEQAVRLAQQYIKAYLKLEDDENNNLANALNLATLSQIQRTDKYIPQEIAFLKKAILDEQMIQQVNAIAQAQIDDDNDESTEDQPIPESPSDDEENKEPLKGDGSQEMESTENGHYIEAPEDTSDEKPLIRKRQDPDDGLPDDVTEEDLKNLFKQYLARAANEDKRGQEADDKWYEGPVPPQEEGGSDEEFSDDDVLESEDSPEDLNTLSPETEDEVTDALAEYVEELKPSERRELTAAVEDKLAEETCPPVAKLSDNCAFMEKFKFALDAEARNLCNRHQMCYACGGLYDRSRHDCDAGYLAEAESLCENEDDIEGCKEDAAGLFMMMVKAHSFVPLSGVDDTCSSTCVMRYVFSDSSK